jgi:hypothetical protein
MISAPQAGTRVFERRSPVRTLTVIASGLILAACCALALADEVLTRDGIATGNIAGVKGGDGGKVNAGGREIALADVARLHFSDKEKKSKGDYMVVMTNMDRIVGEITGGDEKGVIISTKTIGKRKVSIDNLLAVFNLDNATDTAFIEEQLALSNTADIAYLTDEQQTEGVIEKIDAKEVTIKVKGLGPIALALDKLVGMKLAPLSKPKAMEGLKAHVYLSDGTQLCGKLLEYDARTLKLEWFGITVEMMAKDLMSVYFSGGKFSFLSDMEPASVVEKPYFDHFLYHYQIDHSLVEKRTISVRGKKFFKGISVHSKTELTYKLDKAYSAFLSTVGIDDEANGKGDVVFIVYGDGKELFKSANITGKSKAELVNVPVEGVSELKLVVDFGGDLDTMDRAVWADAVLVQK